MKTPDKIKRLVEVFDRNLEAYKSSGYKEANVRAEFIDPFFEALGWDVCNRQGYAEAYKDVITEDAIKVGGTTKAPDYCFRIGGARKFFVEAKKPSVDIKGDISPAYQLRRYAWSARLPLSILTDFEEFAVYDCRLRPSLKDKSGHGRVLYLTYHDYLERWEEIADIFSKQAVLEGRFDKFVESKKKRSTQEVDKEFLKEIEDWRNLLARNIALRNSALGIRELNFAVQKTIDRIIFLRICEDRGIESYGRLQALLNGVGIYERLKKIFLEADDKYNSGIFHFRREKDSATPPDELTLDLKIDDKALKEIFKRLYYPESPYEFSVLGADILGHIYEQFLGKVIKLTKGHQARVEEKPEVRKAGGVYYTPTYIVDYIVKNTVGKLCEGKTPKQIEKLTILDPACGSGSFLIGAYSCLHDYHRDWYLENLQPELGKKGYITKTALKKYVPGEKPEMPIYQGKGGQWYLTTREKKRILLNNIYGVDIDSQAVEVTKLSLLLKVLENENQDSLERQMKLWRERALPNLGNNIKCGNSLIGPDYYDNQQLTLLEDEDQSRINAFDWPTEFPQIFNQYPSPSGRGVRGEGGFDAVIGNPPYIGFHGFKQDKKYFHEKYVSARGKFDIYLPFIERGIACLRPQGVFGYICPTNFMKRDHGKDLRLFLTENIELIQICDFGYEQIFHGATNYTGIFLFQKSKPKPGTTFEYLSGDLKSTPISVQQAKLGQSPWIIRSKESDSIIDHVNNAASSTLGELTIGISEGIVSGKNSVFLLSREQLDQYEIEKGILRPCIRGREISRYGAVRAAEYIIYPYKQVNGNTKVLSKKEMQLYPKAWDYLKSKQSDLSGRGYFERSSKLWFELWCPRNIKLLSAKKLLVPELAEGNRLALVGPEIFYGDTVCGITLLDSVSERLEYFLGLLNSKLLEYFYKKTTVPKAGGYYIYKTMFLKEIPIRLINFSDPIDKTYHERIVVLVDQMLELHKQLTMAKTPDKKIRLGRQIKTTDNQIDQLVYELYGLTEKEIHIMEDYNR